MPLTKEMIATLKRIDVSKDEEKTKYRVKDGFSSCNNKKKTAIVELTGLTRASIYRVFREGAVSAKVAIAMAQILNVSPFYYTGETDEKGECTDELLKEFLLAKGFRELAYQVTPKRNTHKTESESKASEAPAEQSVPISQEKNTIFTSAFSNSSELTEAVAALSEEDAIQLLRALFIRERGGGNAAQVADFVKRCLLI